MEKKLVKKKKKGSVFSRTVAWIHLWPSLIAGVLLVFIALTGTIAVFCDEIIDARNADALYVKHVGNTRIPAEKYMKIFKQAYPDRKVSYFITYKDPRRTVKALAFNRKAPMMNIFLDPYTGKIIKADHTFHFFFVVIHLHAGLLMHGIGNWIVDIATIIFFIELLTGLVLWWPVKWTKKAREQAFTIKWKASFKRVNYDLHNVLGFYSCALSIVVTVSGLVIAFGALRDALSKGLGGDPHSVWMEELPKRDSLRVDYPLNKVIEAGFAGAPQAREMQVMLYGWQKDGYYTYTIADKINLLTADGGKEIFIDRYTGKNINVPHEVARNEAVDKWNMKLHMGAWSGLLGKSITFIAGLVCTSLPVTGFLIWWGRRKKKKKGPKKADITPGAQKPSSPRSPVAVKTPHQTVVKDIVAGTNV